MQYLETKNGAIFSGAEPILLRGMGLGGWLLPEGYMWKFYTKCDRPRRMEALITRLCGKNYAESFWSRYADIYITEQDIAWIAAQGMNSVRLALNARHLFEADEDGTIRFHSATLCHVDDCVQWCKIHGIYVILDMHGAPGGQTGQNIDDSEADTPELFLDVGHQDALVQMWRLLATRYRDEAAVGGYDLLNEPLPEWNRQYNHLLLPLYRRLIAAIRQIDPNHMIILEGAHWATDFSIFDGFTAQEAADNIVLQFHKYWSDPDQESLAPFLQTAERLNAPLWMGEGGENNLEWYTHVFPMYEQLGIGWCFWTYKKMQTPNSPVTFPQPKHWDRLTEYLDGGDQPSPEAAQAIFEDFLSCIASPDYHPEVIQALLRRPSVSIPASAYDAERIHSPRRPGTDFRSNSRATLLFTDGHTGRVDWRRYGGEPQPEDQKLLLRLQEGDSVGYRVSTAAGAALTVNAAFHGTGTLSIQNLFAEKNLPIHLTAPEDGLLWFACASGKVYLENITVCVEE